MSANDFIKCRNMTEEQYRKAPGVNKSTLWELRRSPIHYKYALENPTKDTPALRFGRALHQAILQPMEFEMNYAIMPNIDRRTKEGKEMYAQFLAQTAGMTLITEDEYDTIRAMTKAVWCDPDAYRLLQDCQTETQIFWTDEATRIRCKCRLDAVKPGVIVDLKTCQDASPRAFKHAALKYGYELQMAHYIRGYRSQHDEQPDFYFIAIEKTPPYAINVIHAPQSWLDRGTLLAIDLMDKLAYCRKHRSWGGYGLTEGEALNDWELIPDDE